MNEPKKTPPATTPDGAGSKQPAQADGGPAMQGEGNYTAARRHRESAESFVESGRVEPAARDAAPEDADEAKALKSAEDEGRSHARK